MEEKETEYISSILNLPYYPEFVQNNNASEPRHYNVVVPDMEIYSDSLDNFLEHEFIPERVKILINNCWFYSKKNSHNIISFYAYTDLNNSYALQTSAFQISLMKECTAHNARYNDFFQTKVKLETDSNGKKINDNLILTAYVAETKKNALKQIIHLYTSIVNNIINKPVEKNVLVEINNPKLTKVLERNEKKFVKRIKQYEDLANQLLCNNV